MRRGDSRLLRGLTILSLCAALGLAGCGRKGELDPPSAAVAPPPSADGAVPQDAPPPAPPPHNRGFILDPLLN